MRRPRPALLLLLALLLSPAALAGSARAPEIEDREGDVRASHLDLLAAWLVAEDEGVRFFVRTLDGSQPDRFPDCIYWFHFEVEATGEEVGAVVGFGDDGVFRGHLGTGRGGGLADNRVWRAGFERVANGELAGLREERGRPSTWSAVVPWGAVEGLEPGATLVGLSAGTAYYDREARAWVGGVDGASTDEPFVAERSLFPILVPAWVLPLIVAACVLGGLAGGWGLARATRRRAPPPPPASPAAPATRERFRTLPPAGKR